LGETVEAQLEQARRSLLDLTLRNRLLNFREGASSTIKVVDEFPDEVFRILVSEGKQMSFLPTLDDEPIFDADIGDQPQPRHLDKKLQTAHSEELLQKRLLRIASNARTVLEEQGVNVLYLSMGFLNWYESPFSEKLMKAPLLLMPVELTRENAVSPFKIKYSGEELTPNLSLHEKLQVDFGIDLPSFALDDDTNALKPESYFSAVSNAVSNDDRWSVTREMFLGLFSFGKLMMYLDLNPANWPEDSKISSHPVIVSILEGLPPEDALMFSDEEHVDEHLNPMDCYNVVEADSSQTLAILDVNSDSNMVIEGPPGTGKSQTITNIIAEALARDKTVLFVSEKMAALEVVKRRLDEIGLGDACLELHSHKARKSTVLDEIRRTLDETRPKQTDRHASELLGARNQLNDYASAINTPVANTGVTPFKAIGGIEQLRSQGFEPVLLDLPKPLEWDPQKYAELHDLVHALAVQLAQVGNPSEHPWRGVGLAHLLPSDQPRILASLGVAKQETEALWTQLIEAWGLLDCEPTLTISAAGLLSQTYLDLSVAPHADSTARASEVWLKNADTIDQLISTGESYSSQVHALLKQINGDAFLADLSSFAPMIRETGASKARILNKDYRNAVKKLNEHVIGKFAPNYQDRIALFDLWQSCQDQHRWLEASKDTGEMAFGSQWRGPHSDWAQLRAVFMMSPMSIAQFLVPGALTFDLVVFDEASQVKPEDALGSIARGSQLVVVGDPKQLPPTTFFSRMLGSDDDDEGYTEDITDYESILDKCSVSCNSRRLKMHYRSRHESLIQFSNHEFYDDSLVLFPSPDNSKDECGVRFNYVPGGIYDRGRSRKNGVEAEAVARAVMKHARECPHLKLGVGTFGLAQKEAIEDAIEVLRREDASCENFFAPTNHEPFFVKNLENIQGDERDVIFLSVGYGKDANGNLSMNFGPINSDTGWRRMNVLVTRARRRVEVFSSIRYGDIDTSRTSQMGVRVLKSYLEFAETGNIYYPQPSEREIGSEFQAAVTVELEKHGLLVDPEVGVAGFFIDIGVKNPVRPGEYVLGIECDGASYHSAKSARDRDKLRQAILEDLGWTIHRIWSVDWFNNREREIHKALDAYELALAKRSHVPNGDKPNTHEDATVIVREAEHRMAEAEVASSNPYALTTFCRKRPAKVDVTYIDEGVAAFTVIDVVNCEGPIHVDEIVKRCSQLWGFQRSGRRIREIVERGISLALESSSIKRKGQFMWPSGMREPLVRNRAVDGAPKKVDLIPPEEIQVASADVRKMHVGISDDDLIQEVARRLGFGRVSEDIRSYIARYVS